MKHMEKNIKKNLYIYMYLYLGIYMCVCVCVYESLCCIPECNTAL